MASLENIKAGTVVIIENRIKPTGLLKVTHVTATQFKAGNMTFQKSTGKLRGPLHDLIHARIGSPKEMAAIKAELARIEAKVVALEKLEAIKEAYCAGDLTDEKAEQLTSFLKTF